MGLISYTNGQTSVVVRAKLRQDTTGAAPGKGFTGIAFNTAGLIVSTIADNEPSPTVYTSAGSTIETITTLGTYAAPTATKCRLKKVDDTNNPGIVELQFADARFAVAGAKSLLVSITGVSGLMDCDFTIPLTGVNPYDGVRGGMTALPNAAAGANTGLPVVGTQVPNATAGATGGLLIAGSNAAMTLAALTVSGNVLVSGTTTHTGAVACNGGVTYTNSAGDGFVCSSTGGNGNGISASGNGTGSGTTGHGIFAHGSGSGDGLHALGGATGAGLVGAGNGGGHGIYGISDPGGNGDGLHCVGGTGGDGIAATGTGTGRGIHAMGGGTSGAGLLAEARAGNSDGATFTHFGSGIDLNATTTADLQVDVRKILGTTSAGTAGYVGVDWAHVNAPTTAVNLSGTTISTSQAVASVTNPVTLTSAYDFAKGTVAMTESYAALHAAPTPVQSLFWIQQFMTENGYSGTTGTIKKVDGTTTAGTTTINDATTPTGITRAS